MSINFEGSINNISERQLAFIGEVLEKRGYNNIKATVDPVGKTGDNYMANVNRITVSDDNGIFKVIAKIAPHNEILRKMTNTQLLFNNEHHIYTKILPKYQELEAEAKVPTVDRFRFAACYGSLSEAPNEVILLEDLQTSDFTLLDRFKSLSDEYVKSILKNLASFHSLSFALKNIEPDTFETMKSSLSDVLASVAVNPQMVVYFSQLEKEVELILEREEQRRVIRGAMTESLSLAVKLLQSEVDSKHSVIQQGDLWMNNIMFKFNDDKLQQLVMIDYQLSKVGNPACDILFMIFTCTDHKTRLKHFYHWIDFYHSELDKRLSNFGLKANEVYAKDQLDADMKRYARLLFGPTILSARVATMKSDDAHIVKEAMTSIATYENPELLPMSIFDPEYNLLFKTKLQDLIDSYLQFGLL